MAKQSSTALAERDKNTAMAVPSYIKEGTQGQENIDRSILRPPSLRLAQSGSKETKKGEEGRYIENLVEGEFFITPKTYLGEGPLRFCVVTPLGVRHVEFDPDNLGTVLDMDVPEGDPRTLFTEVVKDGKKVRVKPRATKFIDFLVLVEAEGIWQWAALSFKSTGLKTASDLAGEFVKYKLPTYAHLLELSGFSDHRGSHQFYSMRWDRKGFVPEDVYNQAEQLYAKFAKEGGKKAVVLEADADVIDAGRVPGEDDM